MNNTNNTCRMRDRILLKFYFISFGGLSGLIFETAKPLTAACFSSIKLSWSTAMDWQPHELLVYAPIDPDEEVWGSGEFACTSKCFQLSDMKTSGQLPLDSKCCRPHL